MHHRRGAYFCQNFVVRKSSEVISIILPFKNEENYLAPCVESIINQTDELWELLLIDDNSSDKSPEIAKAFAENDSRIKYLKNPKSGVIEAMKFGYQNSTGSLITRMDGDDLKTPDNLEQLRSKVGEGVIAVGQVRYFREDGLGLGYKRYEEWINKLTQENRNFSEVYKECVLPSPCWLAYRSDFEKAGGFDSDLYPEDYDLCFRLYGAGLHIAGTEGIIHLWRDHAIRTTRVSPHYSNNAFLNLKVHYFLQIDHDPKRGLILWGAGKKGKTVAKELISQDVDFRWMTNNTNKVGHNIYGVILESTDALSSINEGQLLVGVSDPAGIKQIELVTADSDLDVYWFF